MPFSVMEESDGLIVSFTGFTVPYEFQEVAELTAAHVNRPRHRFHIFDFSDIDSDSLFAMTTTIGAEHAVRSREVFGTSKTPKFTALVSPSDKMQAVFDSFIAGDPRPPGHEIKGFPTLRQARTWLRSQSSDGDE